MPPGTCIGKRKRNLSSVVADQHIGIKECPFGPCFIGRGDRIRTCDLVDPNHALYQSELHPEIRPRISACGPLRTWQVRLNLL
jgi:hypothetical protein